MLASSTKSASTWRRVYWIPELNSDPPLAGRLGVLGSPTVIPGISISRLRYPVRKA